jgi:hypothetical protein
MALLEAVAALTVALTTAAVSYETLNMDDVQTSTQAVADAATCHTLTGAAAGYFADNDAVVAPSITALAPYVSAPAAVLARYGIVDGIVTGPGCS